MRSEIKSEVLKYFDTLAPKESLSVQLTRKFAEDIDRQGISLGPLECQILSMMITLHRPMKFVEIGTLTGTTALTILESMAPEAELWSFEKNEQHLGFAKQAWENEKEKKNKKLHLVLGDAKEKLETIKDQGPFDGIFIDGNKAAYMDYLVWAEANLKKGALILADNIFLSGAVWKGPEGTPFSLKQISIMQNFNQRLSDPLKYKSCLVPTDEGLFIAQKLF